jgi:RNA recognition motif-containing protein
MFHDSPSTSSVFAQFILLVLLTDDFRIFCGDLSNDCTDAALESAFRKYPSFLKARVVRDKKTMKTRGYGFVSFKDVNDYMAAMREMNGKYVANRPLKLRKSNWQERNVATKGLKKVMETDIMKLAAMAAKKR